jgi:uncharacterized membrane protein YkvA (DUF1232 family)
MPVVDAAVPPMDTSQVAAIIAERCRDREPCPELDDLLRVIAERQGKSIGDDDLEPARAFVYGYIEQVPYMMAVASTAAENVGLETAMQAILDMVESYWIEGDDIIPDELGVIGLLDDAYCSLTSLQAVSDHYRLQTGKFLFPDDLSEANRAMRKLIGEPYATELDQLVIRTTQEIGLMDLMKAFATPEKRLDLVHQKTIWNHGPVGGMDVGLLEKLGLLDR